MKATTSVRVRLVHGLLVGALVCCRTSVAGAEPPAPALDAEQARAVTGFMDTDDRLDHVYRICPADAYGYESSYWPSDFGETHATLEHCDANPKQCFGLCRTFGSAEYCFALARSLQVNERAVEPRYAQMLFSFACALRKGAGCTNRAAGIRNMDYPDDPFHKVAPGRRQACTFRSFELACSVDDPWGCAMLGEAYQLGNGVTADAALAREAFAKACRLGPDFDACAYAKSYTEKPSDESKEKAP